MLRNFVLMIAVALTVGGVFLLSRGDHGGFPVTFWGGLLTVAVLFERWRYEAKHQDLSGDWEETEERFIDPESGKLMQVWYQPATGERRYLPANGDKAD